ncbi:hypothetical protein JCM19274_5013 [Algibacter lectus]|uniref:Uncharacterized protein n=1 Tax=Algibacter lectus TaxID=221126 RepID=A0A090WJQ1_9FLAO|nr:hypothetical protein [Algibacter lectus]GAL77300.1 hypothetical protein JCM19274_5013 [Algibacter lectus]
MKFSKYNTSVYHEDKFVFFNAYTENFLLLEPFLMDLINASIAEDNLKGLAEIHPPIYILHC